MLRRRRSPAISTLRAGTIGLLSLVLAAGAFLPAAQQPGARADSADRATRVPAVAEAAASEHEITDLGVAMYTANVRLGAADVLPDGTPVGYLFSNGTPLSLTMVDLNTGDLLDSHEFAEHSMISSADIADDHTLFFSARNPSQGSLWSYDPITGELHQHLDGPAGETAVNDLIVEGDMVYGSTYPNAKVWSYDTAAEEFHDYGSVTDDGSYARRITMVGEDLWIGTSTNPELLELDLDSGELTELPLPPGMADGADFFSELTTFGDLVAARYSPAGETNSALFDRTTGQWSSEFNSGWWTYESHDGEFFYEEDETVRAFDLETGESRSIGWEDSDVSGEYGETSRIWITELDEADFPGATLVGFRADGHIWRYNLQTEHGDVLAADVGGSGGAPATVQYVATGGDGEIYAGAYLSSGVMARVDHETGEIEELSGPGQADHIHAHRNLTVVGTYPDAGFYAGSASQTWDWGTNPEHLFTIGRDQGQDRPSAMVSAGPWVVAGTVPNYGERGGALIRFNPFTGTHQAHRNVVPEHSVTALAHQRGFVYGGTSIHGGIDSDPADGDAELFIWDSRSAQLMHRDVVIDGAEVIHSLAFDDDGRLWGMADEGTLFEYDVRQREVVRQVATGINNGNVWGRTSTLEHNPADGLMYATAGGRLFRFDPETMDAEIVVDSGARYAAVHEDGSVYFADSTNLFRLDL